MHPLIGCKRDEIASLCRRYGVRRLYVFGSAAREVDFDPAASDIDFLVEFEAGNAAQLSFRQYLAFRDSLAGIVGRPVDLVMAGAVRNPYLQAEIERGREIVHAA